MKRSKVARERGTFFRRVRDRFGIERSLRWEATRLHHPALPYKVGGRERLGWTSFALLGETGRIADEEGWSSVDVYAEATESEDGAPTFHVETVWRGRDCDGRHEYRRRYDYTPRGGLREAVRGRRKAVRS